MDARRRTASSKKYGLSVDRNLLGPEYFEYMASKSFHAGATVPAKYHNSFGVVSMHALDSRLSNECPIQGDRDTAVRIYSCNVNEIYLEEIAIRPKPQALALLSDPRLTVRVVDKGLEVRSRWSCPGLSNSLVSADK
jgi:hypothetical protein